MKIKLTVQGGRSICSLQSEREGVIMPKKDVFGFREMGEKTCWQSFALELVPGNKCQLRCCNCYKEVCQPSSNSDMPFEFVKNAIHQAKVVGFAEVVLIGGEPTLHHDLPEIIRLIIDLDMKPVLVTNGIRLANKDYVDRVALSGTTVVLHALLPADIQAKQSGVSGYHKKLIQAYENVIGREGVIVVAESVILDELKSFLPDVLQWCEKRKVIPFVELTRRGDNGQQISGVLTPEQLLELFQELARASKNPPQLLVPPAFGQACTMSITGLHIKNFGNGDYGGVYSCCAQGVRHGDLHQKTLVEILDDTSLQVFKNQDQWIFGPCRECVHYKICRGGCRGEAYLAFGCPRASTPVCWHISPDVRNNPSCMIPPTCAGCPLEGHPACHPRR